MGKIDDSMTNCPFAAFTVVCCFTHHMPSIVYLYYVGAGRGFRITLHHTGKGSFAQPDNRPLAKIDSVPGEMEMGDLSIPSG